jgi:hypothetical protein
LTAYVVLQSARRLADELAGRATSAGGGGLRRIVEAHNGVVLPSPTPAGSGDSVFTTIQVPDMDRAKKLATALRGTPGIEAAYAKPAEELP